nr:integrase, catalytic region, zinc finger, CCHC-type, peptidase aspartic, catalytic [Tanacetum cinerariifolium]
MQHSKLNAISELIYAKCNGCMLSDNQDLCVLNDMNARVKSKSVMQNIKRKVWKPTGKVFTNIGYTWRPTGQTFTIAGNACPLTRITTTTEVGISHETSIARSPQKNSIVERRNRTRTEVARTMLIYAKASLFLWAEAVATTCYTQNISTIRLHHGKTPYELLHDKLPDLSFFYVFGALCYPTNDCENLGKLQPKHDIGPALHEMTSVTISSGLMPNLPPSTPFVPPSRTYWDMLFQLLFDELLTPSPSVDHPAPKIITPIAKVVAPEPAASTGSPSSIIVDQDAPSPNNSQTPLEP